MPWIPLENNLKAMNVKVTAGRQARKVANSTTSNVNQQGKSFDAFLKKGLTFHNQSRSQSQSKKSTYSDKSSTQTTSVAMNELNIKGRLKSKNSQILHKAHIHHEKQAKKTSGDKNQQESSNLQNLMLIQPVVVAKTAKIDTNATAVASETSKSGKGSSEVSGSVQLSSAYYNAKKQLHIISSSQDLAAKHLLSKNLKNISESVNITDTSKNKTVINHPTERPAITNVANANLLRGIHVSSNKASDLSVTVHQPVFKEGNGATSIDGLVQPVLQQIISQDSVKLSTISSRTGSHVRRSSGVTQVNESSKFTVTTQSFKHRIAARITANLSRKSPQLTGMGVTGTVILQGQLALNNDKLTIRPGLQNFKAVKVQNYHLTSQNGSSKNQDQTNLQGSIYNQILSNFSTRLTGEGANNQIQANQNASLTTITQNTSSLLDPIPYSQITPQLSKWMMNQASRLNFVGGSSIVLTLIPEHLGKLRLSVTNGKSGQLYVKISANNDAAYSLLTHHVNDLQQQLQANGYESVMIDMQMEQQFNQHLSQNGSNNFSFSQNGHVPISNSHENAINLKQEQLHRNYALEGLHQGFIAEA